MRNLMPIMQYLCDASVKFNRCDFCVGNKDFYNFVKV